MPTIAAPQATRDVTAQIAVAARATGVDFGYLVGQAQIESGLNPEARAATSSATGLYQFIEQTWLGTVDRHGAEHGLGWAAERISRGADGRYRVDDPAIRQQILALRQDPGAASRMAAEFAGENRAAIEGATGRPAGPTDLYLGHFLGPAGAARFLTAAAERPDTPAAALFPAAAAANRGVFYAGGRALGLGEVYARLDAKMARGMASGGGGEQPASLAPPDARTEWQLAARAARPHPAPSHRPAPSGPRPSGELAQLLIAAIRS